MFNPAQGAGFQAAGNSAQKLSTDYNAGQSSLAGAAAGYGQLATQGSPLAQQQLAAANAQGIQQAAGMTVSQKGLNPALAARLGAQTAGNSMNNAANQSAQLTSQAQLAGLSGEAGVGASQTGAANQQLGIQNSANAQIANTNAAATDKMVGGLASGAAMAAMMADGGLIDLPDAAANASPTDSIMPMATSADASSPPGAPQQSIASKFFQGFNDSYNDGATPMMSKPLTSNGTGMPQNAGSKFFTGFNNAMQNQPPASQYANGGKVPALVSPGEVYLSPDKVEKLKAMNKNPLAVGKKIPGKPVVSGAKNSYANDTVKANLDQGGIVIPRSITQGDNAPQKAHDFVAAVLNRPMKRK